MAANNRELCRYFLNGVCRYGSSCFNSHDRNDRPSTVCQYYLKGCCAYGNQCRYDHVRPKPIESSSSTSVHSSNSNTSTNSHVNIHNNNSNFNNNTPSTTSTLNANNTIGSARPERVLFKQLDSNTSNINSGMLVLSKKSSTNTNANNEKEIIKQNNNESNLTQNQSQKQKLVSYSAALTGNTTANNQCEFDNNQINEYDEQQYAIDISNGRFNEQLLCPYFEKEGICPFGYECQYIHGELCDLCNTPCLHPFNEEQREQHRQDCMKQLENDMEEAFATQRSQEKQCGICMDIVWEKSKTEQCFGILENCNHVFCLSCIRKWRSSKAYENKIVKACPECRVKSDYVTPSKFWYENENEKKKIIEDYKNKLGKTACKYFKQGSGHCPFGNKCFYQHLYPDGTKAELPSPTQRRRINRNGILEPFSNVVRVDFELSDDDSEYDIIEFLRHNFLVENLDTESELSDLSLSELLEEYLVFY